MAWFFKKKVKEEEKEDDKVGDFILKTEDEIKIDNEIDKPLPKIVSEEEAFYRSIHQKEEKVEPYKARR